MSSVVNDEQGGNQDVNSYRDANTRHRPVEPEEGVRSNLFFRAGAHDLTESTSPGTGSSMKPIVPQRLEYILVNLVSRRSLGPSP